MPKGIPKILQGFDAIMKNKKAGYKVIRAKSTTDNTSLYTKEFGDDLKGAKKFIARSKNPNFVLIKSL